MKFRTLLALFILIAPTLSYSAMYKYQNEKGNWVYSQHPPADGDYTTIKGPKKTRSSTLSGEARTEKITKARESVIGKKEDKKDKAGKESAKNEDKRAEACEKSKKGLESLQLYRRFKDKDGNVTTMADDERERRIKNAKENINQFCD